MAERTDIREHTSKQYAFNVLGGGNIKIPILYGGVGIRKPDVGDVYWMGLSETSPSVYTVKKVQDFHEHIWTWKAELTHNPEATLAIRKRREELAALPDTTGTN